jgi:parallel beta-helix repeat protein
MASAQPAYSDNQVGIMLEAGEVPSWTGSLETAETTYEPHDPIFIDDNSDFEEFSGSGAEDDPWLITGFDFTASGVILIHIEDTTDHFKIIDCQFNGITQESDAIYLGNVRNGTIEDNYIINGFHGIVLEFSSEINVSENTVSSCLVGLELAFSEGNTVAVNDFGDNDYFGIEISESSSNELFDNDVYRSDAGIVLWGNSRHNEIMSNDVFSNQYEGIGLHSADHNNISDNHVFENNAGIVLFEHSHYNNITWNEVDNNNLQGISLNYDDTNNLVANNTIYENRGGIALSGDSNGNRMEDNTIHTHTWSGIFINNCGNNVVDNNTLFNNGIAGIALLGSHDITLLNNSVSDCPYGVYLEYSEHNTVLNNTVNEATNAYQLQDCSNNRLENNTAENTFIQPVITTGFRLVRSSDSLFKFNNATSFDTAYNVTEGRNNTFEGNWAINSAFGFHLVNCDNNTLSGNIVDVYINVYHESSGLATMFVYSYGFSLDGCHNNTLSGNTVDIFVDVYRESYGLAAMFVYSYGFSLDGCHNNTLSGNTVHIDIKVNYESYGYDYGYGFSLDGCHDNILSGNTVDIDVFGFDIAYNGVIDTYSYGFSLIFSDCNTLSGNTIDIDVFSFVTPYYGVIDTYSYGFSLSYSDDNILSGNFVYADIDIDVSYYGYTYMFDSSYGFYLDGCHNNTLVENTVDIYLNDYIENYADVDSLPAHGYGFYLDECHNNTLSGNTVYVGISLYYVGFPDMFAYGYGFSLDGCHNNTLSGNTVDIFVVVFIFETPGTGFMSSYIRGFSLSFSDDNTLSGNTVYVNFRLILRQSFGYSYGYGFYLDRCHNNTLVGNTVYVDLAFHDILSNSFGYGYGFYLVGCHNNTLAGNTVDAHVFYGGYGYGYGFYLDGCNNNILSGNTIDIDVLVFDIIDAYGCGFSISYSDNNTLSGNTVNFVVSEYWYFESSGFYLEESRFTLIQGNNIISGYQVGIMIQRGALNNITVNYLTNNEIAIWLDFSSQNTIRNNIITENEVGIRVDNNPNESSGNGIYLNLFINNGQHIQQSGLNQWWHPEYELGNFWSNYWGEDLNGDYVGDTDLPHEGVDYFPLLDPSIPEVFGPLPYTDWWLMWRGGWSPVEIQVIDPIGRVINSTWNEIGLNAFYVEDTEWDPEHTMLMIMIGIDPATTHFSSYTFMMTALDNLDYSMDWFVSGGGEVVFERSIENAPLAASQTRVIKTELKLNPDGSLTITPVAQYTIGGILRPIMVDGTSVFHQGSTIPVKFKLCDEDGLSDGTAHVTIEMAQVVDGEVGEFMPANATGAAKDINIFRYDPLKEQYVFNLNTMKLAPGTYRLKISLDDGQVFEVEITIG